MRLFSLVPLGLNAMFIKRTELFYSVFSYLRTAYSFLK